MIQAREKFPLDHEPILHLGIVFLIGEEFKRMPRAEADVLHLIHFAHPALAEQTYNFVWTHFHVCL